MNQSVPHNQNFVIFYSENVGWASTCNTVGQTAGYFLGNVVFLALESAEFCNNYLRSQPQSTGLVTIEGMSHIMIWPKSL